MTATARPRILIADDNAQGVELLEAYLSSIDCDLAIATDGEDTLRKVESFKPGLLLLDIMMPKISGFEVCKRLKANPATQNIVVLMVTALDQPHDIDKAVEAGAQDFLTKPINKSDLLTRVRAALASRSHSSPMEQTLSYIAGVQAG
jgi:DNA-binding response OmpR family regulator